MTTDTKRLWISLDRPARNALAVLGRRCTATAPMIAYQAVRQVLAAAQGDATPALPLLSPAEGPEAGAGLTVRLQAVEAAALNDLAGRLNTTPEAIARGAVLGILEAAQSGALPMVKPIQLTEPASRLAGSQDRRADCNFDKAKLTLEKLTVLAGLGLDPAKPRAHLDFLAVLDEMHDFKPD